MTIRLHDALDAIHGRANLYAREPATLDQQAALVRDVADALHVDLFDPAERRALLMGLVLMAGSGEEPLHACATAGMWAACLREWER